MDLDLNNLTAIRVLGHGATGTVFLVTDRTSPSLPPFALKVIQKQNPDTEGRRARSELSVLSLLLSHPHPFLPSLLGSLETPSLLSLALPFCPAGDLNSLRHSLPDKIFSPAAIRFYLSELISALSHLHSLGIAYRDLKPENILLQSTGHILLTDFDLSHYLDQVKKFPKSATRVSPMSRQRSYSFVGTEEYIAPEVINSSGHTSAVDWWTLGILIYEMIFATTPFKGSTRQQTFNNVLTRDVTFPDQPRITPAGKEIIVRLLHKSEAKRLGSQSGASEVKAHKWFAKLNWGLLRNEKPPIIPNIVNAQETNFRNIRESHSLDLDRQMLTHQNSMSPSTPGWNDGINSPSGSGEFGTGPGTPVPRSPSMGRRNSPAGLSSPLPKEDAFGAFNSVTILHS